VRAKLLVLAGAIVVALATVVAVVVLRGGDEPGTRATQTRQPTRERTYAELAAANYRVLSEKQSTKLLRFAQAFHACMVRHVELGEPRVLPTKIVMAVPEGVATAKLVQLGIACGTKLGDPPPDASLQTRKHEVVLYLPKYCILDRKVVAGRA
jgi:hypothetical protein